MQSARNYEMPAYKMLSSGTDMFGGMSPGYEKSQKGGIPQFSIPAL